MPKLTLELGEGLTSLLFDEARRRGMRPSQFVEVAVRKYIEVQEYCHWGSPYRLVSFNSSGEIVKEIVLA